MKDRLLNEVRRIGDQLLAEAKTGAGGMYWETMSMDTKRNITFEISEGIYSGVPGIVLFFLELYKQTRDGRYMEAAVKGMQWTVDYCRKNPTQFYAFITGRMGVSYTLLKMYEFTGEEDYLEKALAVAEPCGEFLNSSYIDDLINGISGTLLGLVHLHAASGEEWILKAIDGSIRALITRANPGPAGLYWDRSPQTINGLCGFSHGAAGIGFVFLELGRYFQNDSFINLAEQAFLYERHFYDRQKKNWPDLRKGIYNDEDFEEHKKAFLEGNPDFFTVGGDMNAWCHGAAGIGLSRLRAYRLLKKNMYKDEALAAIEKTTRTDIESDLPAPSFTLCHGCGGNAELFIYAYQTLDDHSFLSKAEQIAGKALAFYNHKKFYLPGFRSEGTLEDRSLFMGIAGIGYFYLRLLAPHDVPSIMIPQIDCTLKNPGRSLSPYHFISISLADVHQHLLQKHFPRTLFITEKAVPKTKVLRGPGAVFQKSPWPPEAFITSMETAIPTLPPKEKKILSDVFDLETEKWQMDKAIKSHSLLNIKEKVRNRRAEEIIEKDDKAILQLTLRLDPDIKIGTTQWNWSSADQKDWQANMDAGPDTWPLLLKPAPGGIIETELSPFSYTILSEFRGPRQVVDVIPAVLDAFETLTPDQEKMLKEKFIQQVKQALLSAILIP